MTFSAMSFRCWQVHFIGLVSGYILSTWARAFIGLVIMQFSPWALLAKVKIIRASSLVTHNCRVLDILQTAPGWTDASLADNPPTADWITPPCQHWVKLIW